jgi:hypothetical protein
VTRVPMNVEDGYCHCHTGGYCIFTCNIRWFESIKLQSKVCRFSWQDEFSLIHFWPYYHLQVEIYTSEINMN